MGHRNQNITLNYLDTIRGKQVQLLKISGTVNGSGSVNQVSYWGTGAYLTGAKQFSFDLSTNVLTLTGSFDVSGNSSLQSNLNIAGALDVVSTSRLQGNTTITGTLNVVDDVNLTGALFVKDFLDVVSVSRLDGNTTITGTLNVVDDVNLTGNLFVKSGVDVSSTSRLEGNVSITGTLNTVGVTNLEDNLYLTGALDVTLTSRLQGNTTITGTLEATSTSNLKGNVSITGTLEVADPTGAKILIYATDTTGPEPESGTTAGSRIVGRTAAHLFVDLRANDTRDSFGVRTDSAFGSGDPDKIVFLVMSNGFVGINKHTVNPAYHLDVSGNLASNYVARFQNDGDDVNRYGIIIRCGAYNGATAGTTNYLLAQDGDGDSTGALQTVDGVFAAADLSDQRFKYYSNPSKVNALKIIKDLEVVEFSYNNSKKVHPVGFIAQQAEKVFPYMVSDSGDGKKMTLKTHLIPVLVKAIQEQQKQIDALKRKIK